MKFSVQRLYSKGIRLPDQQIVKGPQVEGELRTREERDEDSGELTRVASLLDSASQAKLLPDLHHVDLVNISPLAMTLRGFERVMTPTGPTEVRQEWWVRHGEGAEAKADLVAATAGALLTRMPMPPSPLPDAPPGRRLRLVQ